MTVQVKPKSKAARVVASTHMWLMAPAMITSSTPALVSDLQEAGVPEGVGVMFLDEGLAGERPDALVNLHPRRIRPEEGGARPLGQVLDVEYGAPGLPEGGEQVPGLGRGRGHAG